MSEGQLDSLVTALSTIACWLRQNPEFKAPIMSKLDGRLKNDLDVFIRGELLPQMCSLFEINEAATANYGMNLQGRHALQNSEHACFEIFVKLGLLVLQILQVVQEALPIADEHARKKQEVYISQIVTKAVESMQKGIQFERCLQIFETSFSLLEEDTVLAIMRKRDHILFRELFSKLASRNTLKPAETSAVYQLLTSYASTEQGAAHLKEIKILDELQKSECLTRLVD